VSQEPAHLTHRVRPAAGDPAGALVLLHGRGADEHDLFPILEALDPQRRLTGVTLRGPLVLPQPDDAGAARPGEPGRRAGARPAGAHWYVVRRIGFPDHGTFHPTYEALTRFFDGKLPELTGAGSDRTVIGGFSQGAVMSYALGLGEGRPVPAGILAMSGFIPAVDDWRPALEERRGLPVAITHGSHDPVIDVEFGRDARDRLTAAGLDVTYRESPVGHGVDPRHIDLLRGWLGAALGQGAAR